MKKLLYASAVCGAILSFSGGAAFADYALTILHINDFHARVESINRFDSTCSAEDEAAGECFGGSARIKTKLDELRASLEGEGANFIVLDAGDQFQGSLFYTTYKSQALAEFMNMMGFDVMAVGNHEFDDGPEELAKFIDSVDVPVISGNVVAGANTPLANKITPYVIKEIGGERIGVLSVVATDTGETSSSGPSVLFDDEIEYLAGAVADLESQGIDKIILLSHVGLPRDREIAAAVSGIDVIVGGHSHTLLSNTDENAKGPYPVVVANPDGEDVPIVQAYAYSKYLGEFTVTFDDAGKVISTEGNPHLLDASVTPDAAVLARIAELLPPIEELKTRLVAQAAADIDGARETCRAGECAMGNLVADALLARTADQGVTIAIQNGGGLRSSIGAGTITMGDVLSVLPFQNTLATFQITGTDIVSALENGVSKIEEGAGRFPQVAGMRYVFDKTQPAGSRIVSVEVASADGGFAPIDPDALYTVATNNYMRNGGDGYDIFETNGRNAYDFGPGLEDVVAAYLRENQPYQPYTDGRVSEAVAVVAPVIETPDLPAGAIGLSASAPVVDTTITHVVVAGDTLWDLAQTYLDDPMLWSRIADANPDIDSDMLEIGTSLTIPTN